MMSLLCWLKMTNKEAALISQKWSVEECEKEALALAKGGRKKNSDERHYYMFMYDEQEKKDMIMRFVKSAWLECCLQQARILPQISIHKWLLWAIS